MPFSGLVAVLILQPEIAFAAWTSGSRAEPVADRGNRFPQVRSSTRAARDGRPTAPDKPRYSRSKECWPGTTEAGDLHDSTQFVVLLGSGMRVAAVSCIRNEPTSVCAIRLRRAQYGLQHRGG